MLNGFQFTPLFLVTAVSTWAWQIGGKVTDIKGVAIGQAQVCAMSAPTNCVASGADGSFSLTGTGVDVNPTRPAASDFALDLGADKLYLRVPAALQAQLDWMDAAGRRLGGEAVALSAGLNRVEAPAAQAGAGLRILRLRSGNLQVTWKTVPGLGGAGFAAAGRPEAPLAKAAGLDMPGVIASKGGYQNRPYYAVDPNQDANAWILMAAVGDDTTYKLPGTSYPSVKMPPNVITGVAKKTGCGFCYGGGQANNILGHSATGRGTFTTNQIFAPADGNYDVTWSYYCGLNDNNGDPNCDGAPELKTPAGCRPGIFVINGNELPTVYQFQCFAGTWNVVHFATFSLPLKMGNANSIKIYSKTADVANIDRIIVKDGR